MSGGRVLLSLPLWFRQWALQRLRDVATFDVTFRLKLSFWCQLHPSETCCYTQGVFILHLYTYRHIVYIHIYTLTWKVCCKAWNDFQWNAYSCFEFGGCEMASPFALGKKAAQIARLSFRVFDSPMIDQGEKRPLQSCLKLCDVESINASVDLSTPNSSCPRSVLSDSVHMCRLGS